MAIELGKAFFNITADDSELDSKLKSSEQKVEASSSRINAKMVALSAAIGGALGSVLGGYVTKLLGELDKIPEFFLNAYKVTAEYGLEMEHLGSRMGMTAEQAAVLTGMMERQGLGAGVAARAMQIMASEVKQTGEALDPLQTRLGKVLGTLRDSNGNLLSMSEILDKAREKINSTTDSTQQLILSQQIFGTRMGGQLLPMLKLSNDEWEKQKESVKDALGPVDEAADAALKYKDATAELDQRLSGLQITIGNAVIPSITKLTGWMSTAVKTMKKDWEDEFGGDWQKNLMDKLQQTPKAPEVKEDETLGGMSTEKLAQLAKGQQQLTQEAEKAQRLGLINAQQRAEIDSRELEIIEEQKKRYSEILASGTVSGQTKVEYEAKILQFQEREMELASKQAKDVFQEQELRAKAIGEFNSTSEIRFLQQQLADARIVGEERLKIEATLFEKKQKYEEEAVKLARELGIMQVQDELKFRQAKARDMLSRGDLLGAAGEMKQIQDLRLREADSQEQFRKKIQIVSIQSEIEFQKQKLDVVRGNAEEERKVLESIADLDKSLYEKRIQYAASYSSDLNKINKGVLEASGAGEQMTPEQARVESERNLRESGHAARQIAETGGTEAQRQAAMEWAQGIKKQMEDMAAIGEKASENMTSAWDDAKAVLGGFGVKGVRDPTGPSGEVGSLTSPAEGLATSSLARGSQIPDLDTSYTDMAIRVRDVFLGTIPNIQSFSDAIKQATTKLTGSYGSPINSPPGGGLGPGGGPQFGPGSSLQAPSTGPSSPAQPGFGTVTVGGQTFNAGQFSGGPNTPDVIQTLSDNTKLQSDTLKTLSDRLDSFQEVIGSLAAAATALKDSKVGIQVGIDPDSQDKFKALSRDSVVEAIQTGQ